MFIVQPVDDDLWAQDRVCRCCGCGDHNACPGGCAWTLVDLYAPTGICDRCAEALGWDPRALATEGM